MFIVRYALVIVGVACAISSLLALGQGAFGYSFGATLSVAWDRWDFFVDPTAAPGAQGIIRAKTMTFDECRAKFAS